MSDDLRLNSIDRFRKRSERLILEEHGHCEVPAGCGGVVMRWFDPRAGVPAIFQSGFADQVTIHIDGQPLNRARATISDGDHLLTVEAKFAEASAIGFWLAGSRDSPTERRSEDALIPEIATAGDGTWLASFSEPPEDWQTTEFDDSGWIPLSSITLEQESLPRSQQWSLQRMESLGAQSLDNQGHKTVWIRKRFETERNA